VHDKWIRGTPGVRVLQRSVKGVIEGEIENILPKPGNNIYLTIDARIQYIAERALRDAGIGRGAAVVVDPNNGEILAMASVPSYDPNTFIPSISKTDWEALNDDDTDPLVNRAIQGYAPGSTFKDRDRARRLARRARSAHEAELRGRLHLRQQIHDVLGHRAAHGTARQSRPAGCAQELVQLVFLPMGQQGEDRKYPRRRRLARARQLTNVPLSGESSGLIPGPSGSRNTSPSERWSEGYTANVSIGQGAVEASPLQMAMVVATIANRGISYYPKLVHRVAHAEGEDAKDETATW